MTLIGEQKKSVIGKAKAHRGDAKAQRKTEIGKAKGLPLINTDDTDQRADSNSG